MKNNTLKQTASGRGVSVSVTPDTSMHMLSQQEVAKLVDVIDADSDV